MLHETSVAPFISSPFLKVQIANTMSSSNNSVSQLPEFCRFTGLLQWRTEYLTPTVYKNLIVNTIVNGLSFPLTAFFNAFFIACILLKPNLRRKKSTIMMGYLAVTDLVVGAIGQPMFLANVLCQMIGRCSSCTVDIARYYLLRAGCGSSLVHVTLTALERYIAIKHALQYKLVVTTKRLLAGIIAAWFISVALVCVSFLNVTLSMIFHAIEVLICFAAVAFFYIVIYLESKRHYREIKANIPLRNTNLLREREFKAAKTTAFIFGCLLICYGPSFVAIILNKSIFPVSQSNATIWVCINTWIPTLLMLNSLCNPFIYGWRVKEFRDVITSTFEIFKCCSRNDTQQSHIEIIELVELNADGRLPNGSFAHNHKSRWNTSINTSDEASQQNRCRCKAATSFSNVGDNVDSANKSEPNDLFSKTNSLKREPNSIQITAMVHIQPKPNLRQPEVFSDDAGTLSAAITKKISGKATTTETEGKFKSQEDIEKSGKAVAELDKRKTRQEMNDKFPCLAAIIDKLEKKEPNRLDAVRKQMIAAERIDYSE